MKHILNLRIAPILLLTFCCLFATEGFAQEKEQQENVLTVTKTYTIDRGALDVTAASGDVEYVVYKESEGSETGWAAISEGTLDGSREESERFCPSAGETIKVEVTMNCDECAVIDAKAREGCR